MAYSIIEPFSGALPIGNIDAGTTFANASSAAPTPPLYAGMVVRAQDPTYGIGEFILLKGVASTVVGSLVRYNAVSFQTVLAVNTAVQAMPVAVAMAANTANWGWYQISGTAVLSKTAVIILPNVAVYLSATAGSVKALASAGLQVVACRSQLVTTASASATVLVTINRPHHQSQVT
jgi:hypothetical protein